jgi:hypothetical protein
LHYLRVVNSNVVDIFSELGRRMESIEGFDPRGKKIPTNSLATAARNIAADMLSSRALTGWLERYPALPVAVPRNVLVITAGNIPFVGVQDLVCVLAAGHRAIVKPSSKDFENMSWVVAQLLEIAPDLPVSLMEDCAAPDAVIAMGSDRTVEAISRRWAGIPMLLRGNRSSAAVLDGGETDEELAGLADDVLMYSGLGCRNVSLLFVPRGYDFGGLQSIFSQRVDSLGPNRRNNYRQTRALLRMTAAPHIDAGAVLLVDATPNPDFPAQPSILHYAHYDAPTEISDWLVRHDGEIQCVAANFQFSIPNFQIPRSVCLGQTQRPRLEDYPDGCDTMRFLETI